MIIRLLFAMSCLLLGTSALAGSDRLPVGSSQGVTSVAVRSDGRLMLSGGHDGTARLWDVGAGKEAKRLFDGRSPIAERTAIPLPRDVMAVTFSLGGSVAAGGIRDGTVRVWEVESGREMMVLRGHEDGVLAVAFSDDSNRIAAGGYDWTVRVWDRKTGKPLHRFEKHQGSVRGVAFVANGSQMASAGDDGTVRFWDLTTGELLKTVELQCGPIHAMAVSQDQAYLAAACRNGTAMLFKIGEEAQKWTYKGADLKEPATSVALSPDAKLMAAGSLDHTIRVWDTLTAKEVKVLKGHSGPVQSVTFTSDGKTIVSGGADKTIRLWDSPTGNVVRVLGTP